MPAPAVLLAQLAARPPQHRASTDAASSEYRYDVDDYYGNWARRLSEYNRYGGGGYDYGGNGQKNQCVCVECGVQLSDRATLISALSAYFTEQCEVPPDSWDVHLVTDFSTAAGGGRGRLGDRAAEEEAEEEGSVDGGNRVCGRGFADLIVSSDLHTHHAVSTLEPGRARMDEARAPRCRRRAVVGWRGRRRLGRRRRVVDRLGRGGRGGGGGGRPRRQQLARAAEPLEAIREVVDVVIVMASEVGSAQRLLRRRPRERLLLQQLEDKSACASAKASAGSSVGGRKRMADGCAAASSGDAGNGSWPERSSTRTMPALHTSAGVE